MAALSNNHNEVMSLDPVDGREIKNQPRGRSRDTSNPRLLNMANPNTMLFGAQMNANLPFNMYQ
jgi:hypothetical protein